MPFNSDSLKQSRKTREDGIIGPKAILIQKVIFLSVLLKED